LDRLKNAQYITLPSKVIEDVAVDSNGDIYAICGDGPSTIYKISQSNTSLHYKIGETEGKVLGTALNQKGNLLLMIDDKLGIRMLDLITGKITTIANEYEGHKFGALNSITFASDNIAYFTDSCNFSMDVFHLEILYKTATGKVYGLNLATGKVTLLLGGLQFPNGIVYS
jgi:sugar lactone lactonase YvrE